MMRSLLFCALLVACGDPVLRPGNDAGTAPLGDAGVTEADSGVEPMNDAGTSPPGTDAGPTPPTDAGGPVVPVMACGYAADDFGGSMRQLDSGPDGERLRFVVQGLPAVALVTRATLRFRTFDADHPGEEGTIYVNGAGPFDLPADLAADNAERAAELDVLSYLVEGDNLIEFGPGPLTRSYFRIGDVIIDIEARVSECMPPPPPPDPSAVERSVYYRDAVYTNRATWVIRCADYAFTGAGDEHTATDCDGGYVPGGNRRGTATFHFPAVVRADYEVIIRSRHTENRNPSGALFIVDGVERRISQRSDRNHTDDLWGTARLEGDIEVVLDSSRESQSDSVISVRLVPVTP